MTDTQSKWLAWVIVAVAVLVVGYMGVKYPLPEPPADDVEVLGMSHLSGLDITGNETDMLVVDQTSTGDIVEFQDNDSVVWRLADGGAVTAMGAQDFDSTLNVDGSVTLGGSNTLDLVIFEHTALTATTTTITPTHTFYSLDTAAAVTITLAASGVEGQLLILINDDANATIIADTNLVSADGSAITMTDADDMAVLIYQDDKWHEIASPNGS
jgi:hypothetical protein